MARVKILHRVPLEVVVGITLPNGKSGPAREAKAREFLLRMNRPLKKFMLDWLKEHKPHTKTFHRTSFKVRPLTKGSGERVEQSSFRRDDL